MLRIVALLLLVAPVAHAQDFTVDICRFPDCFPGAPSNNLGKVDPPFAFSVSLDFDDVTPDPTLCGWDHVWAYDPSGVAFFPPPIETPFRSETFTFCDPPVHGQAPFGCATCTSRYRCGIADIANNAFPPIVQAFPESRIDAEVLAAGSTGPNGVYGIDGAEYRWSGGNCLQSGPIKIIPSAVTMVIPEPGEPLALAFGIGWLALARRRFNT